MLPNHAPLVWHRPNHLPRLEADEVHVWAADLDDLVDRVDSLIDVLGTHERRRVARLKIESVQRRYIASRAVLRLLLGHYTNQDAGSIRFHLGRKGKPSLQSSGFGAITFNNSDTADLAVYAISRRRELGIDVERLGRSVNWERIAHRRFAACEASRLSAPFDGDPSNRFLSCWTRKEAWGKAIGVGIHYPMRDVVLCDRMQSCVFRVNDAQAQWRAVQFCVDERSTACLVAPNDGWRIKAFVYPTDPRARNPLSVPRE